MALRRIVIPIRGDGKGETVLAHAAALARRHSAHIEALHCRPRKQDLMPYGVPVPSFLKKQIEESGSGVADEEERTLREEFRALLEPLGLTEGESGPATASWRAVSGRQVDVLKAHGRLADLIVVAKPDRDRNLGANTLRAALFNAGRPVMMVPPRKDHPQSLGASVTIAWNGSTEAARAVALTLDVLAAADRVTVLSAGREVHGATAEGLIEYLAMRGIEAELVSFTVKGSIGEALLARTRDQGADTMIMGAYGESHERETVFGGNTQTVVDTAVQPVILVH